MNKIYTDRIMLSGMTDCLAVAVENAVLEYGETVESFFDKFIKTGYAASFAKQLPFVTTGCNGEELVAKIMESVTGVKQEPKYVNPDAPLTEYYWIGYAIALVLSEYDITIPQLMSRIPAAEWLRLYPLYHEYGDELLIEKLSKRLEK